MVLLSPTESVVRYNFGRVGDACCQYWSVLAKTIHQSFKCTAALSMDDVTFCGALNIEKKKKNGIVKGNGATYKKIGTPFVKLLVPSLPENTISATMSSANCEPNHTQQSTCVSRTQGQKESICFFQVTGTQWNLFHREKNCERRFCVFFLRRGMWGSHCRQLRQAQMRNLVEKAEMYFSCDPHWEKNTKQPSHVNFHAENTRISRNGCFVVVWWELCPKTERNVPKIHAHHSFIPWHL